METRPELSARPVLLKSTVIFEKGMPRKDKRYLPPDERITSKKMR